MEKSGLKIVNIRGGTGTRADIIYAELRDAEDNLLISATLEYIVRQVPRFFKDDYLAH